MTDRRIHGSDLMTPREVADYFGVTTKTVTRWLNEGLISGIRTPGGTRRYNRADVQAAHRQSEQRQSKRAASP